MKAVDVKNLPLSVQGLWAMVLPRNSHWGGGKEVNLHDLNEDLLHQAIENIKVNLNRLTQLEMVTEDQAPQVLNNIQVSAVLKDAVSKTDLVIEAVTENLKLKQKIF